MYADWRGRFLEALDQRLYPAEWLDSMVEQGVAALLENETAACLVAIRFFPSGAGEVHCLGAAGEIEGIKALAPQAEEWGRQRGAFRASIASHPAWAKIMKDAGYSVSQVEIVKGL